MLLRSPQLHTLIWLSRYQMPNATNCRGFLGASLEFKYAVLKFDQIRVSLTLIVLSVVVEHVDVVALRRQPPEPSYRPAALLGRYQEAFFLVAS